MAAESAHQQSVSFPQEATPIFDLVARMVSRTRAEDENDVDLEAGLATRRSFSHGVLAAAAASDFRKRQLFDGSASRQAAAG